MWFAAVALGILNYILYVTFSKNEPNKGTEFYVTAQIWFAAAFLYGGLN
jgi:hypothetical protein